jgi:hypothetical protein
MKLLLGSIGVAALVASAATVSARPDSANNVAAAMSHNASPFEVNRSAKVDRLPIAAAVRVKTISIPVGQSLRDRFAFTDPFNCDGVVSPIASISASRRLRACIT